MKLAIIAVWMVAAALAVVACLMIVDFWKHYDDGAIYSHVETPPTQAVTFPRPFDLGPQVYDGATRSYGHSTYYVSPDWNGTCTAAAGGGLGGSKGACATVMYGNFYQYSGSMK